MTSLLEIRAQELGKPVFMESELIDLGCRQSGRYSEENVNILHCDEETSQILASIQTALQTHPDCASYFGDGKSDEKFIDILNNSTVWTTQIQKRFNDIDF